MQTNWKVKSRECTTQHTQRASERKRKRSEATTNRANKQCSELWRAVWHCFKNSSHWCYEKKTISLSVVCIWWLGQSMVLIFIILIFDLLSNNNKLINSICIDAQTHGTLITGAQHSENQIDSMILERDRRADRQTDGRSGTPQNC